MQNSLKALRMVSLANTRKDLMAATFVYNAFEVTIFRIYTLVSFGKGNHLATSEGMISQSVS